MDNSIALAALPQAVLFDLDGVLADVSQSYRQAIIVTAQEFGITVTRDAVSTAKAAGAANNDWELTQRLLCQAGVRVSLAEVTARFERIYQGTDAVPGLRCTETLLCTVAWMRALAARLPLGIVTGRPRADAERFLREQGIFDCMSSVVCMEDAPLKPDPAPVRLAMEQLEVTSAWMVGDTPDDVRSALGAGAVPIGVLPPGDAAALVRASLLEAGAMRVLERVMELEELLP